MVIYFALIGEAGGPDAFFQRFPVFQHEAIDKLTWAAKLESWKQSSVNINLKLLHMSTGLDGMEESMQTLQKIKILKPTLTELCISSLKIEEGDLQVLKHGDYWYINMLFLKDPETKKIIGHKALDLQLLRYNSPAVDLTYYLFLSANYDIRQNRLNDLLQYYLTTLKQYGNDLGHSIELTLESLKLQYSNKLHFRLVMALAGMYGQGAEIMRTVDYTKVSGDWGEFIDKVAIEWIVKNPVEAEKMAKEVASLMAEYRALVRE